MGPSRPEQGPHGLPQVQVTLLEHPEEGEAMTPASRVHPRGDGRSSGLFDSAADGFAYTYVDQAQRLRALREAALDAGYVSLGSRRTSSPHEFYRYPARFSPSFARAAIEAFTERGDLVLDPFVGGGTSVVEARIAGRLAVGSDLNPLAVLISQVKAQPHSPSELSLVSRWVAQLPGALSVRGRLSHDEWTSSSYFRNIDSPELAGIRSALIRALRSVDTICSATGKSFARCILLRAGQWALDMRSETPTRAEFRDRLIDMAEAMGAAAHQYRRDVRRADATYESHGLRRTTIIKQAVSGLPERLGGRLPAPKLILTSPPYPGVYVNYHRWKVLGRRETPAPFWLANEVDGNGLSHYTMAARSDPSLDRYFHHLEQGFADLARLCNSETVIVQLVGFHDPNEGLSRYLAAMNRAGLVEFKVAEVGGDSPDGRLWRGVPNRRWWVQDGTRGIHTAQEVVLIHKKAPA